MAQKQTLETGEIISAYREAGDELPAELKNIKFV